jgi:ClpP class serine protease
MNKKLLKLLSGQWAIEPKAMEALCSSDFGDPAWKESNEPNHKNNVDVRNGIAIMHIDGTLTYRSNFWKAVFGVDTYNSIGNAFDELVADESVKGIVLSIDSPGGEIKGVSDLADRIFAARGTKECGIVAHSAGAMCSAAYWIASACEKVVASSVAQVGSIGVMGILGSDEDKSVTYLRSNLSPNKNLDPNTPEGRSAVEKNLDAMAKVFVEALAKNRNSDFDSVLERYGQGKVFVGQEALEAGMVDAIDSLDSVVDKMINHQTIGGNMPTNQTPAQTPAAQATVDVDAVRQEAIAAERTRIAGISSAFEGLGLDGDREKFIAEGKTVDEAKAFCLEACKKQLAKAKTAAPVATAAPANPAANPAAAAGLTAEQKALIAQGMAAGAAAANSVQAGTAEQASDAEKRAFDAFSAGAKNFR